MCPLYAQNILFGFIYRFLYRVYLVFPLTTHRVARWLSAAKHPAKTPWRNGSASDSRSEGCVFKSRRGQKENFYFSWLIPSMKSSLKKVKTKFVVKSITYPIWVSIKNILPLFNKQSTSTYRKPYREPYLWGILKLTFAKIELARIRTWNFLIRSQLFFDPLSIAPRALLMDFYLTLGGQTEKFYFRLLYIPSIKLVRVL